MLSDLLATVKLFFLLAIENRFECPEVFVTHHSAEVPFRSEHGRGCPSFCHRFVSPSANTPGPATHSRMRVLNYVRAGQAPMQRWRHIQPVDGEAFFHAFSQAVGGVRQHSGAFERARSSPAP